MDTKVFGARIRQAREQVAMSQEELAALVSKDQGAISEYESGKRKLSAVDLPLLADALGVPILYFFEEELTGQEYDQAILSKFHQLQSSELKQAAIELLGVFCNAVNHTAS